MFKIDRQRAGFSVRIASLSFVLHILCFGLPALDPNSSIDQYVLDKWEIADGLPSNLIRSIAQTSDGYLWLATNKGLVRFDGVRFTTIRYNFNPETEKKKNVFPDVLFVNREGILWIGGSGGLTRYDHKSGQFKTYYLEWMAGNRIWRINEDMKGNLWFGMEARHLHRYANGKFDCFDTGSGREIKKITAIVEDMKGNLLVATYDNGLFRFRDGEFLRYDIGELGSNLIIETLCEDKEGVLWLGTNKGLLRVEEQEQTLYTTEQGLPNNYVSAVLEDSDGNLWVGTFNGLTRMKREPSARVTFERRLAKHVFYSIVEDREKNLWLGTEDSGLIRIKDPVFFDHPVEKENKGDILYSLFEDRQGDTWIGTMSGRLYRYCRDEKISLLEISGILDNYLIMSMEEDGQGNLWLGTNGAGVFQQKGNTFINFDTRDGLADNIVNSISRDSKGNLWFGTYSGVSLYSKGIIKSMGSGERINVFCEDKDANIWIGTDNGIIFFEKGEFSESNIKKYLPDVAVTCIYEDKSGRQKESVFWIATHGTGLKRFCAGKFISYTTAEGMASDFLYQVLKDEQENLWIMSDSGVLRVNTRELNHFARGRIKKIYCTAFGIADGLKSLQFYNKFNRNSALKTRSGEFCFVTKKGVAAVNPARIKLNKTPPPLVIEGVYLNGRFKPIPMESGESTFKGMDYYTFQFTSPTSLSPERTAFKYKLEGYDRAWLHLPPGKRRLAYYKHLRFGTYTFRVTASNRDGVWNRAGASFTFTLKPCFYQTTLFKITVILLLLGLATGVSLLVKKRPFTRKNKYKSSPIHPLFAEECIKKLTYLMEMEKIYRDESITLQLLSQKLSISPHQLSQIINDKMNQNFSEFVNSYRIREAKKLLLDPQSSEKKILSIAFDVGFNTKASFNNAFKKYTNMTPSQYKKSNMNH